MPYISHFSEKTSVLGPGERFAVWFQGCSKSCPGCINPEGQKIGTGFYITVDELIKKIKKQDGIRGVTISGGEPFLQAEELNSFVTKIKKETDLDIMLYSGYLFEELVEKYGKEFFEQIDIFVDGEYIEDLNNNNMYRGSENQQVYFFTEKYKKYSEKILRIKNRNIQFELNGENELFLIGIPPKGFYEKMLMKIIEE